MNPLNTIKGTIIAGVVLAIVIAIITNLLAGLSLAVFKSGSFLVWIHVAAGITWIGLLYYFNFVQIPSMPKIPDEQKPAVGKVIAPAALFWFRWAAMATFVIGLLLALMNGYLLDAILIGLTDNGASTPIGIGMWLGSIMWFNVWFVIWPNQKRALGIVDADADTKKKSARTAMLFSRTNTLLSIPMLFCMVAQSHGGFFRF